MSDFEFNRASDELRTIADDFERHRDQNTNADSLRIQIYDCEANAGRVMSRAFRAGFCFEGINSTIQSLLFNLGLSNNGDGPMNPLPPKSDDDCRTVFRRLARSFPTQGITSRKQFEEAINDRKCVHQSVSLHEYSVEYVDVDDNRSIDVVALAEKTTAQAKKTIADHFPDIEIGKVEKIGSRQVFRVETKPRGNKYEPADNAELELLRDQCTILGRTCRVFAAWLESHSIERGNQCDQSVESRGLSPAALSVLKHMATQSAHRTLMISDVSNLMPLGERLSDKTIGGAIKELIELEYAERPHGARSGARLTTSGFRLSNNITD